MLCAYLQTFEAALYVEEDALNFLSAIFSAKLRALNKHPSEECFRIVLISQLSQLKQCRLSYMLKDANILMHPAFEPLITLSRNRRLTHMTNMLYR